MPADMPATVPQSAPTDSAPTDSAPTDSAPTEAVTAFAYTPFEAGAYRPAMGLMALKPDRWIEIDRHYAAYLAEKRRLLTERPDAVFAARPEAAAASRELLALLVDHLCAHFPDHLRRRGDRVENLVTGERFDLAGPLHPLDLAGRLVQEDLCLMQAPGRGEAADAGAPAGAEQAAAAAAEAEAGAEAGADAGAYRLTAASLCFPTRWALAEKLGRPMAAIHAPVPFYAEKLARPVDRFFARMKPERPVWRLNWSLTDDPELFQPSGHSRPDLATDITPDNAGARLFLRVERQTLRRLPRSGAICFGIRVYQNPLRDLQAEPATAARLAAAVRELPESVAFYKSVRVFRAPLLAYLDRLAADA